MTGLALWAFGLIWATAGFIIGASLADKAWREDRDTWRRSALASARTAADAQKQATHYEKLHRASPEHTHDGRTYEQHLEDGTIEIRHTNPCRCSAPDATIPVWVTAP